jgi:hypothetical protein
VKTKSPRRDLNARPKVYETFFPEEEEETTASDSLLLPAPVGQVFDSFELIAAPEVVVAQAGQAPQVQTEQTDCDSSYPDDCITTSTTRHRLR